MKKTFIIFITALMISCSGEIYEDQIVIKEDGLASVSYTHLTLPTNVAV